VPNQWTLYLESGCIWQQSLNAVYAAALGCFRTGFAAQNWVLRDASLSWQNYAFNANCCCDAPAPNKYKSTGLGRIQKAKDPYIIEMKGKLLL
jgi:hypothetical protein